MSEPEYFWAMTMFLLWAQVRTQVGIPSPLCGRRNASFFQQFNDKTRQPDRATLNFQVIISAQGICIWARDNKYWSTCARMWEVVGQRVMEEEGKWTRDGNKKRQIKFAVSWTLVCEFRVSSLYEKTYALSTAKCLTTALYVNLQLNSCYFALFPWCFF